LKYILAVFNIDKVNGFVLLFWLTCVSNLGLCFDDIHQPHVCHYFNICLNRRKKWL